MSVTSTEDTLGASMRSHSIIFRVIVFTPGQVDSPRGFMLFASLAKLIQQQRDVSLLI